MIKFVECPIAMGTPHKSLLFFNSFYDTCQLVIFAPTISFKIIYLFFNYNSWLMLFIFPHIYINPLKIKRPNVVRIVERRVGFCYLYYIQLNKKCNRFNIFYKIFYCTYSSLCFIVPTP